MKNNWQTKRLNEICDKGSSNISQNQLTKEEGIYPIFGAGGFIKNISFFQQDKDYISIIKDGAGIGRVSLLPAKSSVIGTLQYIIPKDNIDIKFLYYIMNSFDFSKYKNGATIPHIYFKEYSNEQFVIPTLLDQKRIVKTLDETFEKIEKVKENAEKNLQNSKQLFESYLQGIFANPKKDWKHKTLGDVCSLYQGIAINAKTKHALVEKSDLPLLRIKDLKNNTVEQYIDPNNYPINALVNEDDIIYTRTGSLGLVFRGKRGVLHNNSFKVIPTDELSKDYFFIWLQNPIFKSKILALAGRAAQPDITHAIFKLQEIDIPSLSEQKTIVKKLDQLSWQTKKLEEIYKKKLEGLEELKKSILKKAFSGEL